MEIESYKVNSERNKLMMYLDYDKNNKIFYTNIYFPDSNQVLKTPLVSLDNKNSYIDFEIEKFNLTKYSYLSPINSFKFY
ncbi:MAG: hypothetical protein ACFFAS_11085 [Promethearchaeota archaeon]